jgi:hypothetical protein
VGVAVGVWATLADGWPGVWAPALVPTRNSQAATPTAAVIPKSVIKLALRFMTDPFWCRGGRHSDPDWKMPVGRKPSGDDATLANNCN